MKAAMPDAAPPSLLARVVEHYHRTFCAHAGAQAYLARRGLTDPELLKACRIGYADGSLLARLPFVLVVHPSVPATTAAEFIAYAKANPGVVSYASTGPGTLSTYAP